MLILSFKSDHDGAIAAIDDGKLLFSLEGEKDSEWRHSPISPELLVAAMQRLDRVPDAISVGGWFKDLKDLSNVSDEGMWTTAAGYFGITPESIRAGEGNFMGHKVRLFSSSHARSHVWSAYGMSPFPQGQPVYCLIWEGHIGAFYEVDAKGNITQLGSPLSYPGVRYQTLFGLADPTFTPSPHRPGRLSDAGKLMAIAAYSDRKPPDAEETRLIDHVLSQDGWLHLVDKKALSWSKFIDIGVESQAFKNLAGKFSDALFDRFHAFAKRHCTRRLPLLISGGCGLNCDWNTMWEESNLFDGVFVPPVANDSGSAIGSGVDAQHHYTGNGKISWSVYAGEELLDDVRGPPAGFRVSDLRLEEVARLLEAGKVLGWARGRYEIGPRALGNRSLLAAPFQAEMTERLNRIKQREGYRPIAPLCLEEDVEKLFGRKGPSPYMLHFAKVREPALKAVTHVDGSARMQTVNAQQNPAIYELLQHFKRRTGYGVLCNTSLNFKGRGFINRTSDLIEYARTTGLDGFVVNDKLFLRETTPA